MEEDNTSDKFVPFAQAREIIENDEITAEALEQLAETLKALADIGHMRCERNGEPCSREAWEPGTICNCLPCQTWAFVNVPPDEQLRLRPIDPKPGWTL